MHFTGACPSSFGRGAAAGDSPLSLAFDFSIVSEYSETSDNSDCGTGEVSSMRNINPGDMVRIDSWLPVTSVDGDNITVAGSITTGLKSIVAHKFKERSPDEIWASLTDDEKSQLIHSL